VVRAIVGHGDFPPCKLAKRAGKYKEKSAESQRIFLRVRQQSDTVLVKKTEPGDSLLHRPAATSDNTLQSELRCIELDFSFLARYLFSVSKTIHL
jgi:hypothetical protein